MKIYTLTVLLKSSLSRFTSPVKIVFEWNIVLSSQCQIFIKKLLKRRQQKRMLRDLLTFQMIFKIFLQNYSLSIINAYRSLAKRQPSRERVLGESSGFSHPLGREGGWGLVGAVTASHCKISKFWILFIAEMS